MISHYIEYIYVDPYSIEITDRIKFMRHGELHRDNGPALIWLTGGQVYYSYGHCTKTEYN